MASSNMIVLNSKFNPFSYQELLAPVVASDTEHKYIQEEESKLQALADSWQSKLNPDVDKKAYAQYSQYIQGLKDQSEALARSGLTPGARKNLADLRAGYATNIVPIETAYTTRAQRADEQRKLSLTDPSYLHEKDLGSTSLDEFISNPNLSSKGISGSYFTKAVGDAAEQMSKEMRTDEGKQKWKSILGHQYFEKIDKYGFSAKEVLDAVNHNPNAAAELTKLVKNAVDSSGIREWGDDNTIKRAFDYAHQGLYHAIGTSQSKQLKDDSLDMELKRLQIEAHKKPAPNVDVPYPFAPVPKDVKGNEKVLKGFDNAKFKDDVDFINRIANNPDLINTSEDLDKKYKGFAIPNFTGVNTSGVIPKTYKPGMTDDYMGSTKRALSEQYNKGLTGLSTPTNAGAKVNVQRLQGLMSQYGVSNLKDLKFMMEDKAKRTAFIGNNYQFELTDNSLAIEKLRDRIYSKASSGHSGVFEMSQDGKLSRGSLSNSELDKLFIDDKNKPITLMHNTDHDEIVLTKGGKMYQLDPNIIDPSGKLLQKLQALKTLNNKLSTVTDSRAFDEGAAYYQNRAIEMNTELGVLLNTFQKKQSTTDSKQNYDYE